MMASQRDEFEQQSEGSFGMARNAVSGLLIS
jgi:hypothetical protein